jgi:hypothetical protein
MTNEMNSFYSIFCSYEIYAFQEAWTIARRNSAPVAKTDSNGE